MRRSWITHPYDVYFSPIYLFSVCELTRLQYQSKGLLHLHVCKVHVVFVDSACKGTVKKYNKIDNKDFPTCRFKLGVIHANSLS